MAVSLSDGCKMEGWLHLIRSNRIGFQYPRKRYFVLQDHLLKSFRSVPISNDEDPVRSAIIDSCIRVTDNGRENIQRKVIFAFTLYNTTNPNDQLKLGANGPEEAAKWIQSFQESASKPDQSQRNFEFSGSEPQSLRLNCSYKNSRSINWSICSSSVGDAMTSDVVAPLPWKIFGCQNGLRSFKEAKDKEFHEQWDDHPAIKG
ncbi:protein ENHANCED DISEASE RESISTANCE 2-like isoform X2 [Henckelia pumila]|uniref:protein ENHANCED DISEASE RESISTANCE 2-like isoform X2 n=1 Tax=Henckelia pumila TaxID=405737 RepID=UPI003C6DD823